MKKRILSLILAGCLLLLAACSGNEIDSDNENSGGSGAENLGGRTVEGRYVETDITPPIDGRFVSFLKEDGTIVCFDDGLKTRYESADGGNSWNGTPGPGSTTDRFQHAQIGALLPDGGLLAFIHDEGLVMISPDGTDEAYPVEEIDKAFAEGESVYLSLMRMLDNDRLLLNYTIGGFTQTVDEDEPDEDDDPDDNDGEEEAPRARDGEPGAVTRSSSVTRSGVRSGGQGGGAAVSVDSMRNRMLLLEFSTGQIVAELPMAEWMRAMAAISDNTSLYIMDFSENVSIYNLDDGSPSERPDISFGGGSGGFGMRMMGGALAVRKDGGLYAAVDGSLLLADKEGAISTVLESTAYSIGAPRNSVTSVLAMDDGSIIVNLLSNNQNNRLYKYTWDENASINPDKTLTIWSLDDNSFVRAAIAEFRKKHPDSYIRYEVALSGDGSLSASDAIKTLNTRLLGGNAPDIIVLDGCSAESYADRGMLMDLSGIIDTGDVFDNLLAPFENDGNLYVLPAQFMMPMLIGSSEALAEVGTLDDLVARVVDGNDLPADGGPDMFAGIDEELRSALYFDNLEELTNILWLSSAPSIINNNRLDSDALRRYFEAVKAINDKYELTKTGEGGMAIVSMVTSDGGPASMITGSLIRYTMQQTHYAAFFAGNLQIMQMMMNRSGSTLNLFPGLTPGVWRPSTVVGISADASTPEFAAEFVQTMLSLEIQRLNYGTGLPVTRGGFADQIKAINDHRAEFDMEPFSFDTDALINRLETPSMVDTVLKEMMQSSVESLCKGEIDVEGAVRAIEQSISTYLAERS